MIGTLDQRGFVVSSHEPLADTVASTALAAPGTAAPGSVPMQPTEGGGDLARLPWRGHGLGGSVTVPEQIHLRAPIPVHPASERLPARQLRRLAWQALGRAEGRLDSLPAAVRIRHRLPGAAEALRAAHFPALSGSEPVAQEARERLAFEELLLHQVVLARRRRDRASRRGFRFQPAGAGIAAWLDSLPFRPTGDQVRVMAEIGADLESGRPMQRLLMGEVGSGKTVVALAAMLRATENGGQAALMAPTEVLAEQHAATLARLLEGVDIEVALLTGSTSPARRREILSGLETGQTGMVVGTHALIEDPIQFAELALGVVDEQHRFGVRQRAALDAKSGRGRTPHLLHMSATPIPRTLALLGHGDLDLSELRELPPGRQPIQTRLVSAESRRAEFDALRERLRRGRQAYVVCPLVSESEALQAKAALREAERLRAGELSGFPIAVLHGRMRPVEKQEVMAAFAAGEVSVLVATTVIEVGVDVPNASTIVIEGAERFGLAQLHQLRGRVGRGEHESHCLLVPGELGPRAQQRLKAVAAESSGFRLAELDLRMRGRGEVLGTRQHGLPEFRAASFPEHSPILAVAHREARDLARSKAGETPGLELLIAVAEERFGGVTEETIAP